MSAMASQITSLTIVYSAVYSGVDQRKYQSSASLAFVLGIHRGPVNSPHKGPVTRKMFPFDDVIMNIVDGMDTCLERVRASIPIRINSWPLCMMTHQCLTFPALLALCAGNSPMTSEFPSQRPVTQNFDVFFGLRLNKRLTIETSVIWDATAFIMTSLQCDAIIRH